MGRPGLSEARSEITRINEQRVGGTLFVDARKPLVLRLFERNEPSLMR